MNLDYTMIVKKMRDESGDYYFGYFLELEGCQSDGESYEELLKNLEEAKQGWLESKLEYGDSIPEPFNEFSGKINIRMPKSLHQKLTIEAKIEGISLNQYMLYKLSK